MRENNEETRRGLGSIDVEERSVQERRNFKRRRERDRIQKNERQMRTCSRIVTVVKKNCSSGRECTYGRIVYE